MTALRRIGLFLFLFCMSGPALAQSFFSALTSTATPPQNFLSSRSVALYDYTLTSAELSTIQLGFQRTGIDAIAYFPIDVVTSGRDPLKAYAEYFEERQALFLILLEKGAFGYRVTVTTFNHKPTLIEPAQPGWQLSNTNLNELVAAVLRDCWLSQKKSNYLVNEFPETDITVDVIKGRRQEFYAIDLRVDNLAVRKFGDENMDKALEEFFVQNYPLKYQLVDAGADEQELRRKGFLYVLCFVHTRGEAAKEVLGYDMSKGEKSYASITYPEGQLKLKILPAGEVIYKFYFKHTDNGNVFLGTKWDADTSWLDALRNHVMAFKQEAKIN